MNPTELRLLGVLLDHSIASDMAADVTHGSEFASSVLGAIFDRIQSLRARGLAVDADTLPGYFLGAGVPIPEGVPDPALWSKHDPAVMARELAAIIHADHLRRLAAEAIATARPQLADRAVHPSTTISQLRRDLDDLLDQSATDADDAVLLREVLEMSTTYDWIVPDLLERQDRLVVTGPEGSGKSMLIKQIAVCASAGLHPMDLRQVNPVNVLVVDVENTKQQWQRTAGSVAVRASQMGKRDPRDHLRLMCRGRLDLTNATHEALVHRWIDRYKPDLMVIGPLYKLVPRAITNDDDAAPLIAVLDGIRERGITLVMEAHAGHAMGAGGERDMRPRGSSALLGWPEFGFGVRPTASDPDISAVVKWRGDRDQRSWPKHLRRGGHLPWTPADVGAMQ